MVVGRVTVAADRAPTDPGEATPGGDLARALEAAVAALRERMEAAEQRAEAAEADRHAAETRADLATAERDEANRRAKALKVLLDATKLELAGLRTLIEVSQDAQSVAEALRQPDEGREAKGRWRRAWDGWRRR